MSFFYISAFAHWRFHHQDHHLLGLSSSKVLTVQVVNCHLLQFVHFRYCWSPPPLPPPPPVTASDQVVARHTWSLSVFTGSFVGLLSALFQVCCANPCKALCFSETPTEEGDSWFLVSCDFKSCWALKMLKLSFSRRAGEKESRQVFLIWVIWVWVFFFFFAVATFYLAVFGWMILQFWCLKRWKKLHSIHLHSARCCEQPCISNDFRSVY